MLIDRHLLGALSEDAPEPARQAERLGFDCVWGNETVTDGFLQASGAISSTDTMSVGTSIIVAFSRSPMTTAYAGWDLASASKGRFVLGMASQVKQHIERRFDMPWSNPAERMRDYVGALRAIWHSWRTGDRLDYEGTHYRHNLMTPFFSPPRHDYEIPVAVGAVGPLMTEVAGEVCDGLLLHSLNTVEYLDEVILPALDRGLAKSGRTRSDIFIYSPTFMVMGDTDQELEAARKKTKQQLAFYASTPAYRAVLESVGYGDLQPDLQQLSREREWEKMGTLVDDELLDLIAVSGRPEDMPRLTQERFQGRFDRVVSYNDWPVSDERLADIVEGFHAH